MEAGKHARYLSGGCSGWPQQSEVPNELLKEQGHVNHPLPKKAKYVVNCRDFVRLSRNRPSLFKPTENTPSLFSFPVLTKITLNK